MNTHDIDPEEARRLVKQTTDEMKRLAYLPQAREWFKGQTFSNPLCGCDRLYTPWGAFTIKELTDEHP